jgi:hypothetical protein
MAGNLLGHWRTWSMAVVGAAATVALVASQSLFGVTASAAPTAAQGVRPRATGELDCNGHSKIQRAVSHKLLCTDIRGMNGYPRFFDNGHYIGHDEPSTRFTRRSLRGPARAARAVSHAPRVRRTRRR